MLTVICPIYNEEKHIARFMESIMRQDYPKDDLEVLLVDGMSTDRTREIMASYLPQCPYLRVLDNPHRIVPFALNKGISEARGDIIMRLDAHSIYPNNYFSELVKWHSKLPAAWNIGGVCDTQVINSNRTSESIVKVMSDRFGVGNSTFRTGSDKEYLEVDTVPFGCYKSFVFERIGLYNEKLVRVQDIELNKRLKHAGGSIIMVPSIRCTYIPRDNYRDFYRNRYQTGYWVIKACFITHSLRNLGLRHFIPACFVLALILPLILGFVWWPLFLITPFVALLYLGCMTVRSIQLKDEKTSVWHLLKAFCCIHFSYGIGSMRALVDGLFKKEKS
ncbi:MAG: glycosyltransferase family 2 protein [Bacteroidales bacterium]|nr:glycosyltransferase family 2 protein [Bacteroidales bacterium]